MNAETRVIINALLSYLARGVAAVVGILLVPYLIASLGEDVYGVIGLANAVLAFAMLIDLGLRPAATRQLTRFLAEGDAGRADELAGTSLVLYAIIALAVLAVTVLAGPWFVTIMRVPSDLHGEAWLTLLVVVGSLGVTLVTTPFGAALSSQLRFDVHHITETVAILLRAAIIVAVFAAGYPRLAVWAVAAFIAAVVTLSIQRWKARQVCPGLDFSPGRASRRGLRDLAGFGAYTSLIRFAVWVDARSGPLVVSFFLGAAAVTHFAPAAVLALSLRPLTDAFLFQLQPVVTHAWVAGEREAIRRIFIRSIRYSLTVGGGAMALLGTVALPVMTVWLGPGFEDTAVVLLAWCGTSFLLACTGAAAQIFIGTGRVGAVAALNAVLGAVSLGTAIVLVGWTSMGVVGATLGMLVAQVIRTCVYLVYAGRLVGARPAEALRHGFAGPLLAIAALAGASLALQTVVDPGRLGGLALVCFLSVALFAVVGWPLALNANDRRKALGYLRQGWALLASSGAPPR